MFIQSYLSALSILRRLMRLGLLKGGVVLAKLTTFIESPFGTGLHNVSLHFISKFMFVIDHFKSEKIL